MATFYVWDAPRPNQMYMVYDVLVSAVKPVLKDSPWCIDTLVKDSNGAPLIVTFTSLFPVGLLSNYFGDGRKVTLTILPDFFRVLILMTSSTL